MRSFPSSEDEEKLITAYNIKEHIYGNRIYATLASFKEDHQFNQVIGVHEMKTNNTELIESVRKKAKELELRDSVMMLFANQAQIDPFLPSDTVETIVTYDEETKEFKLDCVKP